MQYKFPSPKVTSPPFLSMTNGDVALTGSLSCSMTQGQCGRGLPEKSR